MEVASLDKIIGSCPMTRTNFAMHHGTGVVAFAAGGFISLLHHSQKQRNDFSIANNYREVDALSFSPNGRTLAVGTKGPNAKLFVLSFNEHFDTITEKTEMKTKENGFSCLAIDTSPECGKLLSVGSDPSPFVILWDLKVGKPEPIGYYHLAVKPNHISISANGKFAIVSGPKLLKLIDISAETSADEPKALKAKNILVAKYKSSNYVSAFQAPNTKEMIYALTDDGTLLAYDKSCVNFTQKKITISCSRIILDCGTTQSMTVDGKLVLVGNNSGTMIAVKCDSQIHSIIGKYSANGHQTLAVACSERYVAGAYDDGLIIVFPRRPEKPPKLTLSSHRGPICSTYAAKSNDEKFVYSAGSDGTVRKWEVIKHRELVSGSSQSQIAARKLCSLEEDFMTSLKGIRCIAASEKYVFAGDNNGFLHMLNAENLEEIQKIDERSRGTIAIAMSPTQELFATGGIDGMIRVYSFKDGKLNNYITDPTHTAPVTSIAFTADFIISSSKEGIRFATLPAAEPFKTVKTDDLTLGLAVTKNRKFVVSCGMGGNISIWRVSNGTLFRKHQISPDNSVTSIDIDPSGLFIAVGLSDSTVQIIDIFSGDIIICFKALVGMITSIHWHQNDILLSGMSGCISRWTMPEFIYTAISEKKKSGIPLDFLLSDDEDKEPTSILLSQNKLNKLVSSSIIKTAEVEPSWVFKEIKEDGKEETVEQNELVDGEDDNEQEEFYDAPRPVFGDQEKRADDIIRASFARQDDQRDSSEEEEEQIPKPEPSSVIKPLNDDGSDEIESIIDFVKDSPPPSPKRSPESSLVNNDVPAFPSKVEQTESQITNMSISESTIKPKENIVPEQAPANDEIPKPNIIDVIEPPRIVESPKRDPPQETFIPQKSPEHSISPVKKETPEIQLPSKQAEISKQEEIKQVTQKFTDLMSEAEELLSIEATNEREQQALDMLKDVVTKIHESATSAPWLQEEIIKYFSSIFTSK